jgi:hypothetical protein
MYCTISPRKKTPNRTAKNTLLPIKKITRRQNKWTPRAEEKRNNWIINNNRREKQNKISKMERN